MHNPVRSSLSVGVAVAVTGAVVVAAPPPVSPAPVPVVSQIQLVADPVPLGGLVTSFLGNQLIYCSIICPDVVKLAVTVPVGTIAAPAAFVTTLASGNPLKALGAAVASVTNPLNAAFDPIITNDLTLVLPRAQNALAVSVVGLLNIATAGPLGVVSAIQTARQNTFDALNDTIPPSQTAPNPRGLIQVVAVEAINVASSILFQALEEGLLGIVQTIDAAATTLAQTGDPVAAFVAGERAAFASFGKTLGYIGMATHNAVVNISAALNDPPTEDATAASIPTPVASVRVRAQHADRSPAIAHARGDLVNQDQAAEPTKTVQRDAAKRPIHDGLAKIRQALRGQEKATAKDADKATDEDEAKAHDDVAAADVKARDKAGAQAKDNDNDQSEAKARVGKDDPATSPRPHHTKRHASADAANG